MSPTEISGAATGAAATRTVPAVQLYTVRDHLAADRAGTLAALAGFGFGAVEPFNILADPEGLRADLDAAGLAVTSVHAKPFGEEAGPVFAAARTLGAATVIVPWIEPAVFAGREGVADLAAQLNEAARAAADHGLRLGYHNHEFELNQAVDGRPALEVLADALDEQIVLEVDTYWAAVGGQDVPALLRRLGDRVRLLHVKDGPIDDKDAPMTPVGAGRMPVADVLDALDSIEWRIVELDRCATDLLAAAGSSLDWLAEHGYAERVRRAAAEG